MAWLGAPLYVVVVLCAEVKLDGAVNEIDTSPKAPPVVMVSPADTTITIGPLAAKALGVAHFRLSPEGTICGATMSWTLTPPPVAYFVW